LISVKCVHWLLYENVTNEMLKKLLFPIRDREELSTKNRIAHTSRLNLQERA